MKILFSIAVIITLFYESEFPQPIKNHQTPITITDAWIRPAAQGGNSALYFVVNNNGSKADAVIDAKSKLADIVEVHESYKMANDRIGMRQVNEVVVGAKSKIEFKPGGYHVMLLDMVKDFKPGDNFDAVIIFKHAGKIKIKAVVKGM